MWPDLRSGLAAAATKPAAWARAPDLGRPLPGSKSSEELVRGLAQRCVRARRTGESKLLASLVELADPDQELAQMEPDGLGTGKARCQGAEPREGEGRPGLREEADRRGGLCLGVVRSHPRGRCELALGRDRPPEPLERGAVQQLRSDAALGGPGERGELARRGKPGE